MRGGAPVAHDSLVANWVFCLQRWPPHPRDPIYRVPTPVAIAALGLKRQFGTSIHQVGRRATIKTHRYGLREG
ncbi:MAG TPA: hypothetical protein VIY29_22015 [Ktedonobacteraceae bacterium]